MSSSKSTLLVFISSSVVAGAGLWMLHGLRKSRRCAKDQHQTAATGNGDHLTEASSSSSTTNRKVALPSPTSVLQLIESRRSFFTKQFSGKTVPAQVIADMIEAARWAPTHHLTQPWHFVILETEEHKRAAGQLLAALYKEGCERSGKPMITAKYEKKQTSPLSASHILAICCNIKSKNPMVEEICSVAMAVQNMHLVATAHDSVGAYWSSSGVYASSPSAQQPVPGNPLVMSEFLGISSSDYVCLGWFFVGDISQQASWPQGRRGPCSVSHLS